MKQKVLITGGLGYIGSHTSVKLLEKDYDIVVVDNLSNCKFDVKDKIKSLAKKDFAFFDGDIRDRSFLRKIFLNNKIDNVIHFAGLKQVGQSEEYPLKYYENNVTGSLNLFLEMKTAGVKSIIFSSSASVYGASNLRICSENSALKPVSVYGKTKLIVENILRDLHSSDPNWKIINLRYFNPVGAHSSGLIGDDPKNEATNLVPFICRVVMFKNEELLIFGDDYNTIDGTGRRDYIHVEDLADGHIAALKKLSESNIKTLCIPINLGTGKSYSVLEVINAFEKASGRKIPYRITKRRPGDVGEVCANPNFANTFLNWNAMHNLDKMCSDTFKWIQMNSNL
tara:strand:- start:1446 stop:2465 length:1020 start_codon:yes stop_codon:yes gene_type:complete